VNGDQSHERGDLKLKMPVKVIGNEMGADERLNRRAVKQKG